MEYRAISTHALREEGDVTGIEVRYVADGISTHALREEGDGLGGADVGAGARFLPTPSVRRATYSARRHSPAGRISTHALREEGDAGTPASRRRGGYFYPRPP